MSASWPTGPNFELLTDFRSRFRWAKKHPPSGECSAHSGVSQ